MHKVFDWNFGQGESAEDRDSLVRCEEKSQFRENETFWVLLKLRQQMSCLYNYYNKM